jgi:hypothetical protein
LCSFCSFQKSEVSENESVKKTDVKPPRPIGPLSRLVLAKAAYEDTNEEIGKVLALDPSLKDSSVVQIFQDGTSKAKAVVVKTPEGNLVYNIAGTRISVSEDRCRAGRIAVSSVEGDLKLAVDAHIQNLEKQVEANGGKPIDLTGHSAGGYVAALIAATRPDLVRTANLVDSPGTFKVVGSRVDRDTAGELYKSLKITSINARPNLVNKITGTYAPGENVGVVESNSHKIDKMIEALKKSGVKYVPGRLHFGGAEALPDGTYSFRFPEEMYETFKDKNPASAEKIDSIAEIFGVSVGKVRIDASSPIFPKYIIDPK